VGVLQPEHLLLLMVIVLIVFGAGKLPQTFGQLGKGVREFKQNVQGATPSSAATARVAVGRYCASCGTPRAPDATFCAKCGAKQPTAT
jgi:sec-independent protein translocase protein TatA